MEATQETGKDVFKFLRDLLIEEKNRAGQVVINNGKHTGLLSGKILQKHA